MFHLIRPENRLEKLPERRFSELDLKERQDLQEWIANQPEVLGEELLVIQKEFDGFADTRERLDLLALDKEGRLVVIENKLDDSGRDVTWQAVKYAAYVSTLRKEQILAIFQAYLDRSGDGAAAERIAEFLEVEDLDEVTLNPGNTQRLFFVARNFRKEVTATVLWLREHEIDARCFRVTPYRFKQEILVDIQQMIPPPEATEFMIQMAEKESEEKSATGKQHESLKRHIEYWTHLLEKMRRSDIKLFQNISPSKESWLTASCGISGCHYALLLQKKQIRVELSLQRPDKEENKWLFDRLHERKEEIEKAFGDALQWVRGDNIKAARIQYAKPVDGYDRERWPEYIDWHIDNIRRLENAFHKPFTQIAQEFRRHGAGAD